uniref:PH domain-containing protein n=1 Tax=Guillardia theta TaxID=55529 RepID=A0A7S4UPT6_GUITH
MKSPETPIQNLVLQLRGGSLFSSCFSGCCSGPPRAKKAGRDQPAAVDAHLNKEGESNAILHGEIETGNLSYPSSKSYHDDVLAEDWIFLQDSSKFISSWNRRYTSLKHGVLCFHMAGAQSEPFGKVPLMNSVAEASDFTSLLFGRSFQYGITLRISRAVLDAVRNLLPLCLPSKVYCLAFNDAHSRDLWLQKIRYCGNSHLQCHPHPSIINMDYRGVDRWLREVLQSLSEKVGPFDVNEVRQKFKENLISGESLVFLSNEDLKDLGIKQVGLRIIIVNAIKHSVKHSSFMPHPQRGHDDVLLPGRGIQSGQPGGGADMEGKESQEGEIRRLPQQSWTQSVLQSISDVTLKSFRSDKACPPDPNSAALNAMVDSAKRTYSIRSVANKSSAEAANEEEEQGKNTSGAGGGMKGLLLALETIRNVSGIHVTKGQGSLPFNKDELSSAPWVPNEEGKSSRVIFAQGWLWKQDSDWTRRWRRRWFVLEDSDGLHMSYYDDASLRRRLGAIPLVNGTLNTFCHESAAFAFCIQMGREVDARHSLYLLAADQEDIRDSWIRLISPLLGG